VQNHILGNMFNANMAAGMIRTRRGDEMWGDLGTLESVEGLWVHGGKEKQIEGFCFPHVLFLYPSTSRTQTYNQPSCSQVMR
jgi:hypothetical protein